MDFIIELPRYKSLEIESIKNGETWIIYVVRSSKKKRLEAKVVLMSPSGDELKQSIKLGFSASNNDVEYEAMLTSLRMACQL